MAKSKEVPVSSDEIRDTLAMSGQKLEGRVWNGAENPAPVGGWMAGKLVAVDRNVGTHKSTMLRFSDPNGDEVAVWQKGTLKTKLTEAHLGKYIMIVFTGTTPSDKGDDMNVFDVYLLAPRQVEALKGTDLPF